MDLSRVLILDFSKLLDVLGIHGMMLVYSHNDENLHTPTEFFRINAFGRDPAGIWSGIWSVA
jgi:hypothetical protein